MLFLLLSLRCSFKREICVCSLPVWWRSRRLWSCFYILSLFLLLLCVMRVLAFVVLWRNVLTSTQTASCRALSNVNCLFPLFSSLLFPLFSSSLFVKKGKGSFRLPCVVVVGFCLNPDSRAQRENQDLLFSGFFFTMMNHLSFFFAKNETRPKTSKIIIGPFFSSIRHI